MQLHKIILTGALALFGLTSSAQRIVFEKQTLNADTTMWKQPVTTTFHFTNKGKLPLTINSVDAGCGCLTVKWPKNPIERGEGGDITITYDAKQLGRYDRIIEVFTNAESRPATIRLKGLVSVGNRQTASDIYPYNIDDIYLSAGSIEFDEVAKSDSAKTVIEIYNGGTTVYTPTLMHLPAYITAKCEPQMIARGRKGRIELTLHGDKLNDLGLNQTSIYLARFAGDKVGTDNELSLSAILLPDLSVQAQQSSNPVFDISTTDLHLGKIGKKKKISGVVTITNTGSSRLVIDRLQAFNPAIMVSLSKSEIFPGESVKMNITLQAKYLGMSKAPKRVLLITNDPKHPKEVVNVSYE